MRKEGNECSNLSHLGFFTVGKPLAVNKDREVPRKQVITANRARKPAEPLLTIVCTALGLADKLLPHKPPKNATGQSVGRITKKSLTFRFNVGRGQKSPQLKKSPLVAAIS